MRRSPATSTLYGLKMQQIEVLSFTIVGLEENEPFGPDEFYIPEALPQVWEFNVTFDLDPHDFVLLWNALIGPYDWAKESILDQLLEEMRHPLN